MDGKEFRPNRSKSNLILLFVLASVFILLGLLFGLSGTGAGYLMSGFGLLLLLLGLFATSPQKVRYVISRENICLAKGKTVLILAYSEIESVVELKENTAEELMLKLKRKEEEEAREVIFGEAGNQLSLIGKLKEAIKIQAQAHSPYRFLSVPIAYTSSGKRDHVQSVNIPCNTVFILLKNGKGYLISPVDTEGFVLEAKRFLIQ